MKYYDYIKSPDWKETKKYFGFLGKKRCFVCRSKKYLNLHHLHYRTVGYEDGSELVWLCRDHHRELHFQNGFKEIPDDDIKEKMLWSRLRLMRRKAGNAPHHHSKKKFSVRREMDKIDDPIVQFIGMLRNGFI